MSQAIATSPSTLTLPFRLRTVLGLLLLAGCAALAVPRMRAAWRLFQIVGPVADYGLCMAGPAGAVAIRGDRTQFRSLVRRRLVATGANTRPFAQCARLAVAIAEQPAAAAVDGYDLTAAEFFEWGGGGQRQSLNSLLRILPDLEPLRDQSWPLARKPLSELIRPTRGAYEAEHPQELSQPTQLRGLALGSAVLRSTSVNPRGYFVVLSTDRDTWAFRSRDQGHSWTGTSAWQESLEGHAHHCVGVSTGQRFALAPTSAGAPPALEIGMFGGSSTERIEFGSPSDVTLRLACDESGAVVMSRSKTDHSVSVYSCAVGGVCQKVALPSAVQQKDVAVDVARAGRMVHVAWSKDGLVRVITARGDKPSLSDSELVFDARTANVEGLRAAVVPSLLGFGKQVMLMLSAQAGATQWALVSDGPGAGYHSL